MGNNFSLLHNSLRVGYNIADFGSIYVAAFAHSLTDVLQFTPQAIRKRSTEPKDCLNQ